MARDEEGVVRRHVLLRWGLPRDPRGSEHVLGFVLTTVATIVVTRAYLQLTGFPQVGGETLHIAHVLWGGLFMALAMVLVLSFAGPVVRPPAAFLGGIGFGLFIDEVGKFLTQDNDYFFQPAPMIMYLTLVVLIILADVLHALDRFFGALLRVLNPVQDLLIVTSDHGNLEDLATRSHTRYPVPLVAWGVARAIARRDQPRGVHLLWRRRHRGLADGHARRGPRRGRTQPDPAASARPAARDHGLCLCGDPGHRR